jgi:hypothetical protein
MSTRIPTNPPRDPANYKIDFRRGYKPYLFTGWCFIVFGIVLLFLPAPDMEVYLFKALLGFPFFAALGFLIMLPAKKKIKSRITAFKTGFPALGKVIGHAKIFVPYKSLRDAVINIEIKIDGYTIYDRMQSSREEIFKQFPVGSQIPCLVDRTSKAVLLLHELNLKIENR